MIASVLKLSRSDCKAIGLKDVYGLHKIIYSLFPEIPGQKRDFLFADKGGGFNSRKILILSEREPIPPEYGVLSSKPVPDQFLAHNIYGFEIVLNPTKRNPETGKIVSVRKKDDLLEWFTQRCEKHGFDVLSQSLQVNVLGVLRYEKNGKHCTHNTATFMGKLRVTDREAFIQSFKQGIGRAKAFGFGLLQIVPIDNMTY
ncbi:MAG: type I-E CRISPR-associated protein Cas6/Cse3/CasE [Pseudomonadota bacterium]